MQIVLSEQMYSSTSFTVLQSILVEWDFHSSITNILDYCIGNSRVEIILCKTRPVEELINENRCREG